jgi:hypothetical protein
MKKYSINHSSFIIAIIICCFSSCKKESSNTSPAISVAIDGTVTNFNAGALAYYLTPTDLSISAYTRSSLYADKMTLEIQSPTTITTGTYTEFPSSGSAVGLLAFYKYGIGYYQALGTSANSNPATITITSIDSKSVKGTFSGDVTLNGAGGSNRKVLSSGTFNVAF